ncbi:MAG TPA: MMPL family transporter [Verrucomicrobiae bacterium]|nr:MMPL family transporter [Verrucomicrobiae bacterium]
MRRKYWFWAGAIFILLVIAGLARLRFDTDVLDLLPNDLPVVQGLQIYQRYFTDSRELIITIRADDATEAESAARTLATELRKQTNLVTSVIWEPAWLEQPAQAAELIAYLWLNQPPKEFAQLTNRLSGTNIAATLAEARDQLATSFSPMDLARRAYDPYNLMSLPENVSGGTAATFGQGQNLFASADGTFRILFVKAKPDVANYEVCIVWLKALKAIVQGIRVHGKIPPQVQLGYTGGPAFVAEISSGMQHDMFASIGLTSVIIAILFWFFHRRWIPMLWLLVLLAIILSCTLAFGGLLFGAVNVVSLGFAGILLGLAVDYGVVHYQEAIASPNAIIPEIRRAIGPSIFWAAVTTISAFLVLNLGGLPGLAQLGSLVALGVMLSALVMLFAFLPPLFRDRMKKRLEQIAAGKSDQTSRHENEQPDQLSTSRIGFVLGITALFVFGSALVLLIGGIPVLDHSANALRPRNSPAYAALDAMKANLTGNREPLWLISRARDEMEISKRLEAIQPMLEKAVSNHVIASFTLPTPLWPRVDYQSENRRALPALLAERGKLSSGATEAGFSTNALVMMNGIFNSWQGALSQQGVFWPTNEMSRWIVEKVAAHPPGEVIASGFLFPDRKHPADLKSLSLLSQNLASHGFILSGWELLGSALLQRVQQNLWKVLLPMVTLVLLSLWLAFRRAQEICLSLAVLCLSGLCLLTLMRLAGWSWNLLNLMALPLMLGSGVDYSIFMQLALRRHHGNTAAAHHSVGRALLLCGGTAVAGFGSLSLSTNAGMASLGEVCAVGIGGNMLISVYLLPLWWRKFAGSSINRAHTSMRPSSLYCSGFWHLGLWLARNLSPKMSARISRLLAALYWRFAGHRREIIVENFMPAFNGERKPAEQTGRKMLEQFALKVADLWRYESGLPVDHLFGEWTGWDYFKKAQSEKRGILLLTPHLGNWEFGGPLLTQRGVHLQVITLAEPGSGFTELRQRSRARWDIDTLVIGEDPFAFVEIIRRLEAGATVALLVDRPPATSRVKVELFGRPFYASIAAAELARASGCVLLPVYLPHTEHGYAAHILPMVPYDRAALRQRDARLKLTQDIIRAFEQPIREHLDQWYHFVPVWPKED